MTRWAMVADLERCVGCQTCTAACKHANATSPAVQWRKVLDIEAGSYPEVSRTFVPVGCQHCADPPCLDVCPSTATRKRADGIVTIDYDICIGCAYCAVACPYQARFKVDAPRFAYGEIATRNEVERFDPDRLGVAQKCTFCVERIDSGLADGLVPGMNPAATPACANACIATALHFGDLDDPESNVSRLLREQRHFRMHEELGTGPGFYYLYADRTSDPAPEAAADPASQTPAPTRAKGIAPALQSHWDWRAAGNFMGGGAGTGLLAAFGLASLVAMPHRLIGLAALALVATGLFLVWLEIGRPWRFLNVLRHPQRSWMTREALVAAFLFPLGALGLWYGHPALVGAAAITGLGFLYCQARILTAARGVPAWRVPAIVPLIVSTGLAEGAGLFLALGALLQPPAAATTLVAGALLALVVLRALAWLGYRAALARDGAPTATLDALGRVSPWLWLPGTALPVPILAAGLVTADFVPWLWLGGLAAFAAGWVLKLVLITRAAFNQGFALAHTPARGAGPAGPPVKPGWTFRPSAVVPH